jgi:hypothetical protein
MKIIQIACDEYRLFTLTEEGDVWHLDSGFWHKLPPLVTENMLDETGVEVEPAE